MTIADGVCVGIGMIWGLAFGVLSLIVIFLIGRWLACWLEDLMWGR